MTYENQLEHKKAQALKLMQEYSKSLYEAWQNVPSIPAYLAALSPSKLSQQVEQEQQQQEQEQKETKAAESSGNDVASQVLALQFEGIIGAPKTESYRNNCEFTCGFDKAGNPNVGFLLGRFNEGFTTIEHPEVCLHISREGKDVCTAMKQFIEREYANYKPYTKVTHTGLWRLVKVRQNEEGEILLMVQVNPVGVEEAEMTRLKKDLIEFMLNYTSNVTGKKLNIVSIYYNFYSGVSNAAPSDSPIELAYGKPTIYETILGVK